LKKPERRKKVPAKHGAEKGTPVFFRSDAKAEAGASRSISKSGSSLLQPFPEL
jgi:hypothetical protein